VRQGLGPFIARSLSAAGAEVPCFLGTQSESIELAAKELLESFGITARGYLELDEMLAEEELDALAILSPADTHAGYLETAAAADLHVLCEKPLVWGCDSLSQRANALLDRFAERGLLICENCQWPWTLPAFRTLHPGVLEGPISRFSMRLSPITAGLEALGDSLSHPLSLLQALIPSESARIEEPRFVELQPGALRVAFDYCADHSRTEVVIELIQSQEWPREAGFSVNGKLASRRVQLPDYRQSLEDGGRSVPVEDPLDLSMREFVRRLDAVRAGRPPQAAQEIGLRMSLMDTLVVTFQRTEETS
jgi:hypothetical protein